KPLVITLIAIAASSICQIDDAAMAINVITSGFLERSKVPITLANDRLAIETALSRLPPEARAQPRAVPILDTLHVAEFAASEALLAKLRERRNVAVDDRLRPLAFDGAGRIEPMHLSDTLEEPAERGELVPT